MRRVKKARDSEAGGLAMFRKLAKADALLFCVAELFRSIDLGEIIQPLERVRAEIAQRLQTCQDAAYADMQLGAKRNARTSSNRPSRKRRAGGR
jgi:hypothetical protein